MLVEWALQEEEDKIHDKKEANKGAPSSGDTYGAVLWPASLTAALAQCIMEALGADCCVTKLSTSHILHNEALTFKIVTVYI